MIRTDCPESETHCLSLGISGGPDNFVVRVAQRHEASEPFEQPLAAAPPGRQVGRATLEKNEWTSNSEHYEALVAARFDALQDRFKPDVAGSDYRLEALRRALGPMQGLRILDLGCGKGRFAAHFRAEGAEVVGLDVSHEMLRRSAGALARVRGSALRLPFADGTFDAVIAVEVAQHWPPSGLARALDEARRVLRPGGRIAIVDRNAAALDARRPWLPAIVVKRIDTWRGRWMYRPGESVRERWFWPVRMRNQISAMFISPSVEYLLSPAESARPLFHRFPRFRSMTLWTARAPGGTD